MILRSLPKSFAARPERTARAGGGRRRAIHAAYGGAVVAALFATRPAFGCAAEFQDDLQFAVFGRNAIYVSPNGDDRWTGGMAEPASDLTDGPLASFGASRDAARRTVGPDVVFVMGGDYHLSAPVEFGPADAGLVITAAPGETPVLHGGPRVTGWRDEGNGRWSAPLDLPEGARVGSLFSAGRKQIAARHPNLAADAGPRDGWLFAAAPAPGAEWQGNEQFSFHAGDVPRFENVSGLAALVVGGFLPGTQWGSDRLPVVSIDHDENVIRTWGTSYFFTSEGSRYFLEGREELLDAPGEWWFDPVEGRVHVLAADPAIFEASVVAGVQSTFFRLTGADDMTVSGLAFHHGAPDGSGKVGTDARGFGAVRVENSDRVALAGNVFENVGVAIHVTQSEDALVARNDIAHTAGNGVYLGTDYGTFGKSDRARIVGNRIRDVGEVFFETAGIWFQAADDVRVAGNLIERASQFGIAGGSLWGEQDASYGAIIEYNIVRNANQRTADGGAIKMMGAQSDLQNGAVRYNLVTGTDAMMNRADGTFWPPRYENTLEWPGPVSWAIYLDGRASGLKVVGNLLIDNVAGIGINGGWNNEVRRNFILGGSGAAFRIDDATGREWRPDWARPNLVEDNSVAVARNDGFVVDIHAPGHGPGFVRFADNFYDGRLTGQSFRMVPTTMPTGPFGGLSDFQQGGQDAGARIGDGSELATVLQTLQSEPLRAVGFPPLHLAQIAAVDACWSADGPASLPQADPATRHPDFRRAP